jgi:hypothetical protein
VAVAAFGDGEVMTACRDGSGDLLLIGWLTPPAEFTITRAADSAGQPGEISEVALAVLGRRAVTAVLDGSGNLLMLSWGHRQGWVRLPAHGHRAPRRRGVGYRDGHHQVLSELQV